MDSFENVRPTLFGLGIGGFVATMFHEAGAHGALMVSAGVVTTGVMVLLMTILREVRTLREELATRAHTNTKK